MGLLVSCSIALVSTNDDISKHLFLSGGPGRSEAGQAGPPLTLHLTLPVLTLTSSRLKGLELDGLNVVDKRGHLLGGVDLTAGGAL